MEISEIFTPSPSTPHPCFVIEWTAQNWEITSAMYEAMAAKGKPCPYRCDILAEPFALHATYLVHPEDSLRFYHLESANVKHYDKMMLVQLANVSLEQIGPMLDWHLQKAADPVAFLQYVRKMVAIDSKLLTEWDYISMEVRDRNFEATYNWLEIKSAIQEILATKGQHNEEAEEERALTHRGFMLLFSLMGVFKQLEGMTPNAMGEVVAEMIGFNVRRTQDILRAKNELSPHYLFAPSVVEKAYNYCKDKGSLRTPLGKAVNKLREETLAKAKK